MVIRIIISKLEKLRVREVDLHLDQYINQPIVTFLRKLKSTFVYLKFLSKGRIHLFILNIRHHI